MNEEIDGVDATLPELGRLREELAITEKYLDLVKKFRAEWHPSGVHDADWVPWRTDEPMTYVRSCAAAYELAGGPSALSTAPSASQAGDAAAIDPPNASTSTTTPDTSALETTTSTAPTTTSSQPTTTSAATPGRLVPGSVVACPDFIEATFRNTGGTPVSIVEVILFIEGIDEQPFGYGTDWTPTLETGETATWWATATSLGLDWIGPGLVSVGAQPAGTFEYVYAEGPNPHSSCTAVAPSTTTTAPAASALDATGSAATCSTAGIDVTFKIRNTGSGSVELYQVALFPGGPMGHSFLEPDGWWPLPTIGPGETVSHREVFSGGSLDTFKPGDELEIDVVSTDDSTSAVITCS